MEHKVIKFSLSSRGVRFRFDPDAETLVLILILFRLLQTLP
jgi:hypothetical protein